MIPEHNDSDVITEKQAISIIIFGEPASKANSRRVVRFGGMSRLIKSEKALGYSGAFLQQCPTIPLLTGDLRVTLHIWYASRRPDLDESLILDLMQGRIYENDRQVKERHCYWHLDKDKPRAEILIEPIDDVEKKPRKTRVNRGNQGGCNRTATATAASEL
jgi:Holliday junction resolvase RusA-like endonuclease